MRHECKKLLTVYVKNSLPCGGKIILPPTENCADSIGLTAGLLYEFPQEYKNRVEAERALYENGNLYFSVEVLYPWALYYMFTLKTITEVHFRSHWFEDLEVPYNKYAAEKDEALLRYFVQLIWEALQSEIPDDVLSSVYEYTSLYAKKTTTSPIRICIWNGSAPGGFLLFFRISTRCYIL